MEKLVQEIAKVLGVTVDKAMELYPVIKKQFISYKIINTISGGLVSAVIALVFIAGAGAFLWLANMEYENKDEVSSHMMQYHYHCVKGRKVFKIALTAIIVLGVLSLIVTGIQYTLAPDFMLLKEFIL